ncbi:MAG: tetratricopeptide repeat protein [Deltaproteobacteria bacterium]|nr:tetratricopeptide repeat protein [Deltaproteobacteria bacterium]
MTRQRRVPRAPRQSLCCVFGVVAVALATTATAKNGALARAQALYDAFRYDEAYVAYNQALATRGNTPDQIASIYLHLGIVAAAMDRPSEASEHFKRLLCVNPQAQLAEDAPPKVQGPFLVAQEATKQLKRFRLIHTPPSVRPAEGPLQLEIELEPDSLGLATGVAVRYREAGGAVFKTRSMPGAGRMRLALSAQEIGPGRDLEYYVQVSDANGGVLWEYGSESSPIAVRADAPAPAVAVSQAGTSAAPTPDAAGGDRDVDRPWYQNGWVWVAAGGVAALLVAGGTTAAVAVAVNQSSTAPVHFGSVSYRIAGD